MRVLGLQSSVFGQNSPLLGGETARREVPRIACHEPSSPLYSGRQRSTVNCQRTKCFAQVSGRAAKRVRCFTTTTPPLAERSRSALINHPLLGGEGSEAGEVLEAHCALISSPVAERSRSALISHPLLGGEGSGAGEVLDAQRALISFSAHGPRSRALLSPKPSCLITDH
jgi:hypothetical protein